ncbi:MAG: hypothetical protein JWO33_2763, partial [Caulobacteraceae bacterium]|nr:hypothetical protein [Caulobacteraceae bacterium]
QTLNRIGAWACGLSIPPDAPGAVVRYVADNLAQVRPGAVLCHPIGPGSNEGLCEWIEFLFSATPAKPPRQAGGFVYCQPELVLGTVLANDPAAADSADEFMSAELTTDVDEPAWVSAARRFSETIALQGQRWAQTNAVAPWGEGFGRAYGRSAARDAERESGGREKVAAGIYEAAVVDDTLRDLEKIVASHRIASRGDSGS